MSFERGNDSRHTSPVIGPDRDRTGTSIHITEPTGTGHDLSRAQRNPRTRKPVGIGSHGVRLGSSRRSPQETVSGESLSVPKLFFEIPQGASTHIKPVGSPALPRQPQAHRSAAVSIRAHPRVTGATLDAGEKSGRELPRSKSIGSCHSNGGAFGSRSPSTAFGEFPGQPIFKCRQLRFGNDSRHHT